MAFQPISWYLTRLETSFAVLIELGEQTGHQRSLHVARCALVAGVSVACGRRLLILGEDIDGGPIDYRDLLRSYKNAADAAAITGQWLAPLPGELQELEQIARSDITFAPSQGVPFSALLLSMVTASRDLWRDWEYRMAGAGYRAPSLLLFLRSDIFASILQESDEPDKVDHQPVYWEDADALLELLNRRIEASLSEDLDGVLNWNDLLEPEFSYDAMKQLIASSILGRPRDIIYYFGRVFFNANRRGATSLAKRDFDAALRDYSEYALQALSAEWSPHIPDLGDSLLEFWGGTRDITNDELRTRLISSGVEVNDVEGAVRFLVDAQFLGLAIDDYNYKFASTSRESIIMMRQAGRFIHDRGGQRKFRIHRAFQQSLGLSPRQRPRASC